MASSPPSSARRISIPFFFLLLVAAVSPHSLPPGSRLRGNLGWWKKVGGWMEVPDAGSNSAVRELGRYSVNEYNFRLRGAAQNPLTFSGVMSARRQVVSGIKYRIWGAAVDTRTGDPISFVAVVVVRPWLRQRGRDLVSFSAPSDENALGFSSF